MHRKFFPATDNGTEGSVKSIPRPEISLDEADNDAVGFLQTESRDPATAYSAMT